MRRLIPDPVIAQTMLWIWVGVVIVAVLLFVLWGWWRKANPPPRQAPTPSYSQALSKRLAAADVQRKAQKRSRPPDLGGLRKP